MLHRDDRSPGSSGVDAAVCPPCRPDAAPWDSRCCRPSSTRSCQWRGWRLSTGQRGTDCWMSTRIHCEGASRRELSATAWRHASQGQSITSLRAPASCKEAARRAGATSAATPAPGCLLFSARAGPQCAYPYHHFAFARLPLVQSVLSSGRAPSTPTSFPRSSHSPCFLPAVLRITASLQNATTDIPPGWRPFARRRRRGRPVHRVHHAHRQRRQSQRHLPVYPPGLCGFWFVFPFHDAPASFLTVSRNRALQPVLLHRC